MRHSRRKSKKRVNSQAKKLAMFSFVEGCRGHPGILVEKRVCRRDPYGSDVSIKSLLDGIEESCSILHCAPDPLTGEYARWATDPINHQLDQLRGNLGWIAVFTDFSKSYTEADFEKSKQEVYAKFQKFHVEEPEQLASYNSLKEQFDNMISGKAFTVPSIYPFPKYRDTKPRPTDFATDAELSKNEIEFQVE